MSVIEEWWSLEILSALEGISLTELEEMYVEKELLAYRISERMMLCCYATNG